ncbi:MAG TPA: DapH/DapD/GlmU-related protein [Pirellulales bacterium]|jgi:acetyltransferase-like isoleucine patch superfamily enzyme|nr:DapH/DapD/GlmU-related protein [Pirellulales bacterium]
MFLRYAVERYAQRFRGPNYRIEPAITDRVLLGIVLRRVMALARCLLRGVVLSVDPRRLVFIGPGVELRNRSYIRFGRGVTLGKRVTIDGLSREGINLADGVSIGPYTIIEATSVLTKLGTGCWFGKGSSIGAFSYVGAGGPVRIGENVIMGVRISFHAENHRFDRADVPIRAQGVTSQGIVIEDDCWIGANVVFLDGAHVESGCVIAAGAVVRGNVPKNSVAGGVPARVLKSRLTETEASQAT